MIKKFLGIILLFFGLIIIFYGLYSSYNIFTAKNSPPIIFSAEKQVTIPEQLKGLFPTDSIPKLFNLISWSIFAGILIFGGSQVATLGIKLIK